MKTLVFDNDGTTLDRWPQMLPVEFEFEGFSRLRDGLDKLDIDPPAIVIIDESMLANQMTAFISGMCKIYRQHLFVVTGSGLTFSQLSFMFSEGLGWAFNKPLDASQITEAFPAIYELAKCISERWQQFKAINAQFQQLTVREKVVLDLVLSGVANRDAAVDLNISVRTVESRRAKVYRKLNSSNIVELVRKFDCLERLRRRFTPTPADADSMETNHDRVLKLYRSHCQRSC